MNLSEYISWNSARNAVPRILPIHPRKMMRMLEHLGYRIVRIRGSHHFFFNTMTRRTTSIPLHGGEELGIGLIKQILRDIEVSAEEYDTLRKEVS